MNNAPVNSSNEQTTTGTAGAAADRPRNDAPRKIPAPGSLAPGRPNFFALLKALRKRCWRAILLGLVVGLAVAVAIWLMVPAAKHSASAKLWLKEKNDGLFNPHKQEVNFAM